jgi:hypothetical protein
VCVDILSKVYAQLCICAHLSLSLSLSLTHTHTHTQVKAAVAMGSEAREEHRRALSEASSDGLRRLGQVRLSCMHTLVFRVRALGFWV